MKKVIMLATMLIMVAVTSTVFARTFSDGGVKISAENGNGKIHVQGNSSDIDKYVRSIQFCPDQIKYQDGFTCGLNWAVPAERISANEVVFHLNMNAGRAVNFKNNAAYWSQVLSSKVIGNNVVVEMSDPSDGSDDGRGGCHYTYVGDLPAGSYVPYKPELCGGNAGGKYVASAKPAAVKSSNNESAVASNVNSPSAMAAAATDSAAANNTKAGVVENHIKNIKGHVTVKTKIKQLSNTNTQGGISIKGGIRNAKGGTMTISLVNSPVNINVQRMGDKAVCTDCSTPEMWGVFEKYLLSLPKQQEGPTKESAKKMTIQSDCSSSVK